MHEAGHSKLVLWDHPEGWGGEGGGKGIQDGGTHVHLCFVAACGLSLRVTSRGHSLVAVCRLLILVAPLVGSTGCIAHRLSSCAQAQLPEVCGIFPDRGSNPHPPTLAGGLFVTTGPPGK